MKRLQLWQGEWLRCQHRLLTFYFQRFKVRKYPAHMARTRAHGQLAQIGSARIKGSPISEGEFMELVMFCDGNAEKPGLLDSMKDVKIDSVRTRTQSYFEDCGMNIGPMSEPRSGYRGWK